MKLLKNTGFALSRDLTDYSYLLECLLQIVLEVFYLLLYFASGVFFRLRCFLSQAMEQG